VVANGGGIGKILENADGKSRTAGLSENRPTPDPGFHRDTGRRSDPKHLADDMLFFPA